MTNRRQFLRQLGLGAASLPFLTNLNAFAHRPACSNSQTADCCHVQPNGTVPWDFWPDEEGENFTLKRIMEPLKDFAETHAGDEGPVRQSPR